jgi:hypothetical protein
MPGTIWDWTYSWYDVKKKEKVSVAVSRLYYLPISTHTGALVVLTEIILSSNPLPILKYLKRRSMSFSGWQKVTIKTINGDIVGIAPL